MKDYIIVVLVGYLFGMIQASYLLGMWLYKVDVRKYGKGNAGASNATESFGFKFGALVGVIDILKAFISIALISYFYEAHFRESTSALLYFNGLGVILGHNFPFYMGFKGGKGTASMVGMMWGLNPLFGLGSMIVMAVVSIVSDYIAIGTAAMLAYGVVVTLLFSDSYSSLVIMICLSAMSLYLHRKNFARIQRGEESRVSKVLRIKK